MRELTNRAFLARIDPLEPFDKGAFTRFELNQHCVYAICLECNLFLNYLDNFLDMQGILFQFFEKLFLLFEALVSFAKSLDKMDCVFAQLADCCDCSDYFGLRTKISSDLIVNRSKN